jgi:transcriptional regulator with XRE-family HTH domain
MATGIGLRIRRARNALGWSQEDLAKSMGLKSKSTICKVERGDDNLTSTAVRKYADALGVTPGFLMGWEHNSSPLDILEAVEICEEGEERKKEELVRRAMAYFEMYQKASPEVQQAVDLMLKSAQPKP